MKAVYFARVSTREQAEEGYSLPAQEKLLKDYAGDKAFSVIKKFAVPESARGKQERKLFNGLLDYIISHPNIKIVICEKVDRITRNLKDAARLDDWLNEDETRQLHFVKQNLIIHKNAKSHDKFMWDIYVALARQYSNNLSEEAKKGLNEKAEQGWYPGSHKRGYKTTGEMGHKIWVIDDSIPDAKFIEIAFVLYDTGNYTLRTVAQELFKQGWSIQEESISISELHKLLSDPFFCGEFYYNGRLYKNGKHQPIISKELFYRVQNRLKRVYRAGKYRKRDFLFGGGLVICGECERVITWELQKGHEYGHCTKFKTDCTQKKYTREETIGKQLLEIFDGLKITNPRLLEWIRKALKESHADETQYHEEIIKELDTQYKAIEKKMNVIYEDRVEGLLSKERYQQKQAEYEKQLGDLMGAKQKHMKANINYMKLGINIFELAQKGREIYEKLLTYDEKRELLNFVFSNLKLKDEKVVPIFHNGFQVVAARAEDGNWQGWKESNPRHCFWRARSYH